MALLSIRLLGAFVVERDAQPVTTFRSLKNQALLAYLAMEAGRPHTRPSLAGLRWPEQPEHPCAGPQARRCGGAGAGDLQQGAVDQGMVVHGDGLPGQGAVGWAQWLMPMRRGGS